MSVPANPETTDIGPKPVKVFGDRRAELPERDLTDPDEVFDLARAIHGASDRRLMQVSLAELRALARLALRTAPIATQFLRVVDLSDAGASKRVMKGALTQAAEVARKIRDASDSSSAAVGQTGT